jgi:hypothetical protein
MVLLKFTCNFLFIIAIALIVASCAGTGNYDRPITSGSVITKPVSAILTREERRQQLNNTMTEILEDTVYVANGRLKESGSQSSLRAQSLLDDTISGDNISVKWDVAFERAQFYSLGKYNAHEVNDAVILTAAVSTFLIELQNRFPAFDDLDIVGEFYGSADGTPITSRLIYSGEYGIIDEKEVALENKYHERLTIMPNQKISNLDLAFLRAYGLYSLFMDFVSPKGLTRNRFTYIKFFAKVMPDPGENYRFGKIIIKFPSETKSNSIP